MAIDIYYTQDRALKNLLFSIKDDEYNKLSFVLTEFKRLTGSILDQYGTTRLTIDHIHLLLKLISKDTNNSSLRNLEANFALLNADVMAYGD